MTKKEFVSLVGKDVLVDYPFGNEMQVWNMSSFRLDKNGEPYHKRLSIIMEVFIENARNPRERKEDEHSTHGAYINENGEEF